MTLPEERGQGPRAAAYDPEPYWSMVATEIAKRGPGNVIAGYDTPYTRYKRSKCLERFLRPLDIRSKVVVEVGCGPGGNLRYLAEGHPARLVGVDISAPMLDLASRSIEGAPIPVELMTSDGATIPLSDRSVDLCLTVTVLQHNVDSSAFESMIQEVCRVSAERVVMIEETDPVRRSPADHVILRPIEEYATACERHGFQLEDVAYLDTRATRFVDRVLRAAVRRLGFGDRANQPGPSALSTVLMTANVLAKPFDTLLPERSGLTLMGFRRSSAA
jgi:ubiquinone/menaquinone biosynthesis C-methylase UbiE